MSARLDMLRQACDDALIAGLSDALKESIRRLVAGGQGKRAILLAVRRAAGGTRSMTYLACAAWVDRMLREYA